MLESNVSTLLYRLRRRKEKQDRVVFTASRSINYSEIRKRLACLFLVSHGVNLPVGCACLPVIIMCLCIRSICQPLIRVSSL